MFLFDFSNHSGRQLFESNQALITSDSTLIEADAEEFDLSQFPKEDDAAPTDP